LTFIGPVFEMSFFRKGIAMKTRVYLIGLCVLVVLGLLVQPAVASIGPDPIAVGSSVKLDYASGWTTAGNGGPFTATTAGGSWLTFCIEDTPHPEYFVPGATYTVASKNNNTAALTNNVISNAGKWFYYEFRLAQTGGSIDAGLATIVGSLTDVTKGGVFQNVIWGETYNAGNDPNIAGGGAVGYLYTPGTGSLEDKIQTYIRNLSDLSLADNVEVFNPTPAPSGYPGQAQTMLDIRVPEPASLIVWSVLGAGAASVAVRRHRNARWSAENRQAIHSMVAGKL
jgi:hypothetical protein